MKCIALLAALCCISLCAGQSISVDFLNDNLLNPMLDQIYTNALNMLGQQLNSLINGLFGGIGKRSVEDLVAARAGNVVTPYLAKVKTVYNKVFKEFSALSNDVKNRNQQASLARVQFGRIAADAQVELSQIKIKDDSLQSIVDSVQKHFANTLDKLESALGRVFYQNVEPARALTV